MKKLFLCVALLAATTHFSLSAERPSSTEPTHLSLKVVQSALRAQCLKACRKGNLMSLQDSVLCAGKCGFETKAFLNEGYGQGFEESASDESSQEADNEKIVGDTPLIAVCKVKGDHVALVNYLLDCGADIDARSFAMEEGVHQDPTKYWTPLAYACYYDNQEIAITLLKRGACSVNIDSYSNTPLTFAAQESSLSTIKALLVYNPASFYDRGMGEENVLLEVVNWGFMEKFSFFLSYLSPCPIDLLQSKEIKEVIDGVNEEYQDATMEVILEYILKARRSTDPSFTAFHGYDKNGDTLLHNAAHYKCLSFIKKCLEEESSEGDSKKLKMDGDKQ